MTATIYIPTYQRVGRQFTWEALSPEWRDRAFLVARPEEAESLELLGYQVLVAPTKGIAPTRQWIMDQHDVKKLGPYVIMMDDDLQFFTRRTDVPTKFERIATPGGFNAFMDAYTHMLTHVAAGGVAARSGANRDTSTYRINSRFFDITGLHLPTVRKLGVRFDRVSFMEDFDLQLQLLSQGYPTLVLNSYCKDDKGSNQHGGCSTYRDGTGQAAAAVDLALLHPEFVRITERPGWSGMGDTRTDVTIAWKKAYEAGVAHRRANGIPLDTAAESLILL